jgi:hypothetical protein
MSAASCGPSGWTRDLPPGLAALEHCPSSERDGFVIAVEEGGFIPDVQVPRPDEACRKKRIRPVPRLAGSFLCVEERADLRATDGRNLDGSNMSFYLRETGTASLYIGNVITRRAMADTP